MISASWFCLLQSYASRPSQIRAHINKAWIPCGAISIHYSITCILKKIGLLISWLAAKNPTPTPLWTKIPPPGWKLGLWTPVIPTWECPLPQVEKIRQSSRTLQQSFKIRPQPQKCQSQSGINQKILSTQGKLTLFSPPPPFYSAM